MKFEYKVTKILDIDLDKAIEYTKNSKDLLDLSIVNKIESKEELKSWVEEYIIIFSRIMDLFINNIYNIDIEDENFYDELLDMFEAHLYEKYLNK